MKAAHLGLSEGTGTNPEDRFSPRANPALRKAIAEAKAACA